MSVTETIDETTVTPWDPDEPMMAHHSRAWLEPDGSPYEALCGAKLIGVKAPFGYQPVCATCERIVDEWLFGPAP